MHLFAFGTNSFLMMIFPSEAAVKENGTLSGEKKLCQNRFYLPFETGSLLLKERIAPRPFPSGADPFSEGFWFVVKQIGSHRSCLP